MLTFCSCGYFVISNRAYSYECEHSTPVRDVYAGSRVNYSEPHSQNRISRCLLFAHVVTSSHQFCRTVLRMRAFDACQGCFAGSRVNYSEPHSQNRISRCLLFAHVVTSSHQFCRTVLRMRAFDACAAELRYSE